MTTNDVLLSIFNVCCQFDITDWEKRPLFYYAFILLKHWNMYLLFYLLSVSWNTNILIGFLFFFRLFFSSDQYNAVP